MSWLATKTPASFGIRFDNFSAPSISFPKSPKRIYFECGSTLFGAILLFWFTRETGIFWLHYLVAVLTAAIVLIELRQLYNSNVLQLNKVGFYVNTTFRKQYYIWQSCGPFGVRHIHKRGRQIYWDDDANAGIFSLTKQKYLANATELSTDDLCSLMNLYRDYALKAPNDMLADRP